MKYEVLINIKVKDKEFIAGTIVTNKDIPQKSIKWLLEEKIIVKVDKAYQLNKMQEIAGKQEEE